MPGKKIQELGKPHRKTEAEWQWRKNYRVWDANRRIFLYRENWTEPELHLPARFRVSLSDVAIFIRPRCRVKGFRILLAGKNRTRRLLAAQTLARDLEKDLYRIDLNGVVSDYIGETEKNLGRVFDLAKKNRVVLFFDEADALFGKCTDVKDSHDSHARIEIKYVLRRAGKNGGLTILAIANRTNIDKALMRRFHFVIRIPQRRKLRGKESSTC
jgi:ATPases of the AAA+ class